MNSLIMPQQTPTAIQKILIIGAECTGKTTLCQDLSEHFNTVWVGEYMRKYLAQKPNGYVCQYDDLLPIAIGQLNHENKKLSSANRYVFCDTSAFEIMTYAHWYFGRCPDEIVTLVQNSHYDLILLTDEIGIVWQADGMRDLPNGRSDMRAFFVQYLDKFHLKYHTVSGDRKSRVQQVEQLLNMTNKAK